MHKGQTRPLQLEGFVETIIKDTWTITAGGGREGGREVGRAGDWAGVGEKVENCT